MAEIVLQTHELTKKYGDFHALDRVSLTLHQGDIYGLIGRNGAGKTTFFKCIMGLAKPSSGTMVIGGDGEDLSAARRRIGFVINPAFFSYLSARENLEYLCRVKGITGRDETRRVLDLVDLASQRKPYGTFSLGMKQRLGIAGALLGSPPIVILDEPINGLDPQGIIDMRSALKNINTEAGTTLLISSHILSELDLVATTFGFIERGVLLKEISHSNLHEQTRKTLVISVDRPLVATELLAAKGISCEIGKDGQLTLQSHLNDSHEIARLLVEAGFSLYDLHRRETTLEEYFLRLAGEGEC